MSSDCSMNDPAPLQIGVGRAGTGKVGRSVRAPELSRNILLRHLAEVAALSEAEGDLRLAEHLVDVVYHLAMPH